MVQRRINNAVLLITLNGIIALLVFTIYKYFSSSLNIDNIIIAMDENTKKFATRVFLVFFILMLTSKIQLRVIEKLKETYPWALALTKYAYIFILSGIMALLTSYFMEYFQLLENSTATTQWVVVNTRIYLSGALFLFFIYLLVFTLIGNIYISSIITAVFIFVIGFAHYNKLNLRVEPLYPSDFSQIAQLKDVIPMVRDYLSVKLTVLIVVEIGIFLYIMRFLPKAKTPIWMRGLLLVATAGMVYSFTFFPTTFMKSFVEKESNVAIVKWDQLENYKYNGFIFGFISNLQNDAFPKPANYSKENVLAVAKKYRNISAKAAVAKDAPKQPNIVYIMSEAFWDPTMLTNVQFSDDPMKNLRKLMGEYTSGYNLSPSFGGATANVEFEALTGFSNYFLRVGSLPYQDLIDRKSFIPTIVSDLKSQGYATMAMHPYNKVFYKRNKVYQTFGFDQFIDMTTFKHQDMAGPYISDESVSNEIIDRLKAQKKPMFIHAVTMQNHFPYLPNRFEKNNITVSGLSPDSKVALEVYSEGIRRSDQALQDLVNQLQQLDEPTILVFWGDHMPILGQDLAIYKEAKYANTPDKNLYEQEYSQTPLLMYSNFHLDRQDLHALSPAYFGPTVFEMAGLKKPPFYNLLDKLKATLPVLKNTLQMDGSQKYVTDHLNKKQKNLLNDYQLLEYDLLVGNQYSKDILFKR
ncbi:LTA synthase family protein [Neobacillus ginsengisoli]|uniref:Phosphoglycerol transferase MdoB-like AlkP superfamily enzyme n=1 Tax=Neobacillus ginsengisoli TaxID=904295 RepID=A0ABT9XU47_9BACI|nr:LTA synthase family protein [Neobacillus ginsengisoli]MDQ0199075.1 phosphoglycerol transferase MdoB-like AlkP superfamily enzyme [Neobacillus ginsengisoli]